MGCLHKFTEGNIADDEPWKALMQRFKRHRTARAAQCAAATAGSLLLLAFGAPADAANRNARLQANTVKACSHFGHGCIIAPVRPAKFGMEVRMPGGTWIGCGGDCKDTIVAETIDFWDIKRQETPGGNRN